MGSRYQADSDSDDELELESDDDLIIEEMTDAKLRAQVADMTKQVLEQSCPVDIALINLKQIKHTFSKQNTDFCNAIYPAILGYTS